jgi:hypothetical protein
MTVQVYNSTDASAPVLYGAVGSLISLLTACLVNGYGSKSAAGWSLAYSGTNQAVYLQGSGSNGKYLNVDDSGSGSGGAREALMCGTEGQSAAYSGTAVQANATLPFPTSSQFSGGVVCRKSTSADSSNARVWTLVADATCFYLFVDTGDYTGPNYSLCFAFGDIFAYKSGDTYATMIMGRSSQNQSSYNYEGLPVISGYPVAPTANTANSIGQFMDRSYTGIGGSIPVTKIAHYFAGSASTTNSQNACGPMGSASAMLAYPNGPDGSLELSPVSVCHNGSVRGYMKGLWAPCHYQPCGHRDTFSGTGNMAGKSFLALNVGTATPNSDWGVGGQTGQLMIETSNTWS